jgi:gamma-glutamyltranspeptidase/glutathione hydrolase
LDPLSMPIPAVWGSGRKKVETMQNFTTRPEISGTFGVVTTTHWIASAVGMKMLEQGGNAFDAAVAAGFVLQVVEPHLNGPGSDMSLIYRRGGQPDCRVICGQGTTPAGATIAHYRGLGLKTVPGSGLLATVVPGAFDAWMILLRDHGVLSLRDVLEPAIYYAEHGHPALARVCDTIKENASFFEAEWQGSYDIWCPNGTIVKAGGLLKNPALAQCWTRLLQESEAVSGREAQIERARNCYYQGFIAEEIDLFIRHQELSDEFGVRHKGVLTGEDMANWSAQEEAPLKLDYHGWTVHKTGPWGQGPVLLQSLALLKGHDLAALDPNGAEFVHLTVEAMKLAFADREIYYGDPNFCDVPMRHLLSDSYNDQRRQLIMHSALNDLVPGHVNGFEHQLSQGMAEIAQNSPTDSAIYEPTMAHLASERGDTVHLDIIDRLGNVVSATPSGGWLQSSPAIPALGFCLNTRAQMMWLRPGLPSSLAPNKRPRTTLTPSIACFEGRDWLAFGTPGGDQQDQWQLGFFLRHVHHGLNLQQAIDAPMFHSSHFPSSFYPRGRSPGEIMVEASFPKATITDLKARGHKVVVAPEWSVGRVTAASTTAGGILKAGATPRMMQAYAIGR